jgi:chaperonin GroEL
MPKDIYFSEEARAKVLAGISKLAAPVKATLGPKGRNVLIQQPYGAPQIVNDGVTIARSIELEDPLENMGAELVKEAAAKTNDLVGDGTTTATVLTEAIAREGMKNLAAGADAMGLRAGILHGAEIVGEALKKMAQPVSGDMVKHVATISAQDGEVGAKIAEAVELIKGGPITVQEAQQVMNGIELEVKAGMQFDQGFLSPYFMTDPQRAEAVYTNVTVLLVDGRISSNAEFVPFIEKLLKAGQKELVIIAEDVDGEVLPTLIVNKMKGVLGVVAVKAPGFGDRRKAMLQDIAVVTGATVISADVGLKLDTAELSVLGQAGKVVVTKDHTTIADGKGTQASIDEHVASLRMQIEKAKSDFDREKLQERLAKITGGVAVLTIGANSETELREKKLRIEDAINATRAAIEEGIVPGGGYALLLASKGVNDSMLTGAQATGAMIVLQACEAPLKQIAQNAGLNGEVVMAQCIALEQGFNAATNKYGDLVKEGVIDPVKVVRTALANAASVASTLITMECAVVEIPKKEKNVQD